MSIHTQSKSSHTHHAQAIQATQHNPPPSTQRKTGQKETKKKQNTHVPLLDHTIKNHSTSRNNSQITLSHHSLLFPSRNQTQKEQKHQQVQPSRSIRTLSHTVYRSTVHRQHASRRNGSCVALIFYFLFSIFFRERPSIRSHRIYVLGNGTFVKMMLNTNAMPALLVSSHAGNEAMVHFSIEQLRHSATFNKEIAAA
jgi:hypothetical protein